VVSLLSSRLVSRFGSRVVAYGAAIQAVGVAAVIAATLWTWPDLTILNLAPRMALIGVGNAMTMTTLFRVVLSGVPGDRAGVGSGALATTQQTALALGVATLGTLFADLNATPRTAFTVVLAAMLLVATAIAVFGRRLP
jgi:hypothetical protein